LIDQKGKIVPQRRHERGGFGAGGSARMGALVDDLLSSYSLEEMLGKLRN
jgi:hypothetical protein